MATSDRVLRDSDLACAIARGLTVADAAREAGVSERTAYRRLEDRAFQRLINELRHAMFERAAGRLADIAVRAVETLDALLAAPAPAVRLGAARTILEIGPRLRELTELEQRIAALEQRVVPNA